jgi:hypothetical protein
MAEGAEAVVFEIEQPVGVVEWFCPADRGNGLDAWEHV